MEEYRILVVEDEKTIAEAVQARLAMWGLKAETVTDFRNVMADFERVRPHLVLMDISLPFMNGYLSTFWGKYAIFLGKNLEEWGKVRIFAA